VISKRRLLFNAATFVPGVLMLPPVRRVLKRHDYGTGGTDKARYCYSVWLRHLERAAAQGLDCNPSAIAEIGPGDSLGIGLAAMLSGAERYYAFDVVAHASAERNLATLEDLIALFDSRAPIPDNEEFPKVGPLLGDYRFPHSLLGDDRLRRALQADRLERIRASLRDCASPDSMVQYRAPWSTQGAVEENTLDLVFSQAALEHVDDLEEVYEAIFLWLKPGGYMSHQIDFKCHGSASEWNGHWAYSDLMWALVRGKDVWLINRAPCSRHLRFIERCGFRIVAQERVRRTSSLRRSRLARRFRDLTDDDLTTTDAFVQAVKPQRLHS
jgi:hypothetical protein